MDCLENNMYMYLKQKRIILFYKINLFSVNWVLYEGVKNAFQLSYSLQLRAFAIYRISQFEKLLYSLARLVRYILGRDDS